MIKFYRLEFTQDPDSNGIVIKAFWIPYQKGIEGQPGFVGSPMELFLKVYPSLKDAESDLQALQNWNEIVSNMAVEPYSSLIQVLESLKQPLSGPTPSLEDL